MELKNTALESTPDGDADREKEESCGCKILPGGEETLSCMPLTMGDSLLFKGVDGIIKAELKPIAVDVGMRRPAISAFELIFSDGVKVLLDYPDSFSSDSFKFSYEQEYRLVNEEYLKLCLDKVAPGIEFEMGDGILNIMNPSDDPLLCHFRKREAKGRVAAKHWKSPTGADGSFDGELKGGVRFAARTVGMPGASAKSGWNEDNAGCGNGRLIVADGLGGGEFGECASSFIVEEMLSSGQKVLTEAAREAHYRFFVYNRHLLSQSMDGCDTVLAAVQFEGNRFEAVNFGDTGWIQVRAGKVIARGRRHSFVAQKVEAGELTPLEALVHPLRNYVGKTVGTVPMEPDIQKGQTEKGDIFWIYSDGLALTEEEICEICECEDFSPEAAADLAMQITTNRNDSGVYFLESGGVGMNITAPGDNATVIVAVV